MKLIKSNFKIIKQDSGIEGIYKIVELGGKVCYQSTHTIKEDSAEKFVKDVLIKNEHYRPLEHGAVYLTIPNVNKDLEIENYWNNPYTKVQTSKDCSVVYISTNMRVLVENEWLDDLKYLCEPTEYHEKRVTVNVVCDRQIQTEIKTHTSLSSTFESTRFCNYNKDKFGNELTFIESDNFPNIEIKHSPAYDNTWEVLMSAYEEAEAYYMTLIEAGVKPQFAAKVLPFGIKGEGYITGFISDWEHFFKMRTPENAHPDIQNISKGIKEEFIKLGYINN